MIALWKSRMAWYGCTYQMACECKTCKPFCSLFSVLRENPFTVHRRKDDWFDPRNPLRPGSQREPKFRRNLEQKRTYNRLRRRRGNVSI